MKKLICLTLAVILSVCALPCLTVAAAGASVGFTSPAIPAETGDTVKLSDYSVELVKGKTTAAENISWSSDDIEIKDGCVSPASAGVYKLTATSGSLKKTVYLVVKAPSDSDYILFFDDFDDSALSGYDIVQQTSGTSYAVKDGKLTLTAGGATGNYIRVLLPAWLGDFGDYELTTSFTISKVATSTNWFSLMFRIQKNNYPYWQACVRQGTTAANGTEIAERTSADKWNVTHKGSYTSAIKSGTYYTLCASVKGKNTLTRINDTDLLFSEQMTYDTGRIGFQVKGATASVDYIKVALKLDEVQGLKADICDVSGHTSNIALSPSFIRRVDSAEPTSSAVCDTELFYVDSSLNVLDGSGNIIAPLEKLLSDKNNIIPAFYPVDSAAVLPLCKFINEKKLCDMFFVSDDPLLISKARKACTASVGVLDCTKRNISSKSDLLTMRDEANAAYAKIILLPMSAVTRENVGYLQRLVMTVWADVGDCTDEAQNIRAITAGVNGIVATDDAAAGLVQLEKNIFTDKNSLIRPVNIIGHRGVPSLEQENSLKSAIRAYELGATMIENDIYLTKDNVIVVMHDDTLDRTTNGTGNIENYTYEQLKKFSIDITASLPTEPIPTLEDYFREFKGKDVQLVIEIKKNSSAAISRFLADLIKKYDIAEQVNVITFSTEHIAQMRHYLPGISTGYLTSTGSEVPTENGYLLRLQNVLGVIGPLGTSYHPPYVSGSLGPVFLRAAAYRGVTVWPWTIAEKDIDTYILYGTSGITTNYSQKVTNYLREISAPVSELALSDGGTPFSVRTLTYGRKTSETDKAEMLVVAQSDGMNVKYKNGVISSAGDGRATVIFKLSSRLSNGTSYTLYTEPVTITKGAGSADTTLPSGGTDTTSPQGTPSDTTGNDTSSDNGGKSGCSSSLGGLILLASLIPAALIFRREKGKKSE